MSLYYRNAGKELQIWGGGFSIISKQHHENAEVVIQSTPCKNMDPKAPTDLVHVHKHKRTQPMQPKNRPMPWEKGRPHTMLDWQTGGENYGKDYPRQDPRVSNRKW